MEKSSRNYALCQKCLEECRNSCQFEEYAEERAQQVTHKSQAFEAHFDIFLAREQARSTRLCPEVNNVDPKFPGKENL